MPIDELPIFSEDESDGGNGDANAGIKRKADDPADPNKKPEVELLKTKRIRRGKPFTEDLLVGPHGLHKIYNEFPLKLKYQGRGTEAKFLSNLMAMYKEWAFQLHPGLSFQDVMLKCNTLGSKGQVRGCVQNMRDRERDRYVNEVLLPIYVDKLAAEALLHPPRPATEDPAPLPSPSQSPSSRSPSRQLSSSEPADAEEAAAIAEELFEDTLPRQAEGGATQDEEETMAVF